MTETMRGAGGGGKSGGASSFVQKPDTLRSNDTFEGLLGLCAGPIKGPVNGMKSIRINATPIEAQDNTENFPGVIAVFADGDPLKFPQIVELKLGAAGAPVNVGVSIENTHTAASGIPGDWVSRTVPNVGAHAIDLRFIINQLYKQNKSGIFENVAHLEIEMKPIGTGTWINPFGANGNVYPAFNPNGHTITPVSYDGIFPGIQRMMASRNTYTQSNPALAGTTLEIIGKTNSAYVKELRIAVPNSGVYANKGWDIRVRLSEPSNIDADPNFEKRDITWESMTAVYNGKLGNHEDWRALAWLQIYGKASDNFNGLPNVDGIYDTKIVSVPPAAVFNPDTRVYTGATWDGSWEKSYTNDPAWVIADAISDSISGIASFVPGTRLNKWDALELSKWCSQMVPDGKGGTHARFSLNVFIDQAQKSDELIRFLAGSCGATAWDNGDGEWRCKVDKPQSPAAIFTHENIESEFVYSHTDVDTRFNDVTVIFNNEEFDFREDWIKITKDADIALHGRRPTRLVTVGCTNRQQALRWGVQRLRTNLNEFRMVSFITNRQGKHIERFDHILIADNSLNDLADTDMKRTTGRIIQNLGTTIQVRDPVRLEIGVAYKLRVTIPNPAYNPSPTAQPADTWGQPTITITRNITNDAAHRGDVTELTLDAVLPATVAENANVALEAVGLPAIPRVYRVVELEYKEDGERVGVAAIEVDTGKWSAADYATDANIQSLFKDNIDPPIAPVGGMFTLGTFTSQFGIKRILTANWDRPESDQFDNFRVEYRFNQGPWQDMGVQRDDFWELADPTVGRHELQVFAVSRRGFESKPLVGTTAVPDLPTSLAVGYGPAIIEASYDYTGVTAQDLPKSALYKLIANGVDVVAVTWDYRVTDGGVNGFTPASGWKPLVAANGVATFTVNNIQTANSRVEIRGMATAGGSASETVAVKKVLAPPPAGAVSANQASGFTGVATPGGTFVPVTGEISIVMPASITTTETTINLVPIMPTTASNDGPWDVEFKLQRKIGATWTDVGTLQHSDPDPYTFVEVDGGGGGGGGAGGGGDIPV